VLENEAGNHWRAKAGRRLAKLRGEKPEHHLR
jgi:hypothetical protein